MPRLGRGSPASQSRPPGPSRAKRLSGRVPGFAVNAGVDAELAAAAWACEMTALEAASDAMPDRQIAWLDFDRALTDLAGEFGAVSRFFGFEARSGDIERIAAGPLTRRYSKALEFDYSPGLRRDLIAQATSDHRGAIGEALVMLERAAQESPLLARAMARSKS